MMADKDLEKFLATTIIDIAKARGQLTFQVIGFLVVVTGWVATSEHAQALLSLPLALVGGCIVLGGAFGFHLSLQHTQVDIEHLHDRLKDLDSAWAESMMTMRTGGASRYSVPVIGLTVMVAAVLILVAVR